MTKKLSLSKETLRTLSADEAKGIDGGVKVTVNTCYTLWGSGCAFPSKAFCQK